MASRDSAGVRRDAPTCAPVAVKLLSNPVRAGIHRHIELVAEGQHLGVERSAAPEQGSKSYKQSRKGRGHAGIRLTQLSEVLNGHGPDGVLGRHTHGILLEFTMRNESESRTCSGVSSEDGE